MRSFSKIYEEDSDIVGKKAVELTKIARLGIPIPDGFVITTSFFKKFLETTGISKDIEDVKKISHPSLDDSIEKLYEPIRKRVMRIYIPHNLTSKLHEFYRRLAGLFKDPSLNIFSSSPSNNKSVMFEGVRGDTNLLLKIKEIWALQIHEPVAIIVQKNIQSKIRGTVITNDPMIDKELIAIAKKIQKHFYFPKVLDYVIEKGKIYITQVRPFTGKIEKSQKVTLQNIEARNVLIKGISINPGIVTGPVKVFRENHDLNKIKSGEIIVLPQLNKALFGKIKKAKAIVTDSVLLNSYDQMLYRKNVKIPIITNTVNATKILQNGNMITVNGINGEIYSGGLI